MHSINKFIVRMTTVFFTRALSWLLSTPLLIPVMIMTKAARLTHHLSRSGYREKKKSETGSAIVLLPAFGCELSKGNESCGTYQRSFDRTMRTTILFRDEVLDFTSCRNSCLVDTLIPIMRKLHWLNPVYFFFST